MNEHRHPPSVMQAPIGPAAAADLVIAVSSAGGLGCLGASWTPLSVVREQIREITRAVDAPFCVNLVMCFDQDERLELLAQEGVPAVSLSWGAPAAAIARAHAWGAQVFVQVGDLAAGEQAARDGADVLIAQGLEAGGHVEASGPLHQLVRGLQATLSHPILAAGGISDPGAAAAAVAAGATGVAVGTAYLAALEADVHDVYRERVLAAAGEDTVLTGLFDVGWPDAPHRVLRNETVDDWEAAGRPESGSRPGEGEPIADWAGQPIPRYSDAMPLRATTGDVTAMAMYAGQGVGSVVRAEAASSITERLLSATRPVG